MSRKRTPERLSGLVDSHCHLQDPAFDADRQEVVARAETAGIERILVPGYDLPSSYAALELAASNPALLQAAVGIHPHHASTTTDTAWAELETLAADRAVVAVGEIGLDFYRNLSSAEVQQEAFARQLALAATLGRPVLVHDRDAHPQVTEALLSWARPDGGAVQGVLHAFSGDEEMARSLAGAGFLISFALPVVFKSAAGPRSAACALAADQLLVETDAPWLAPGGAEERNEPTTALRVASELGRLRDVEPQLVADGVRAAYERLIAAASTPEPAAEPEPEQAPGLDETVAIRVTTPELAPEPAPEPIAPDPVASASPTAGIGLGVVVGSVVALVVIGLLLWLLVFAGGTTGAGAFAP